MTELAPSPSGDDICQVTRSFGDILAGSEATGDLKLTRRLAKEEEEEEGKCTRSPEVTSNPWDSDIDDRSKGFTVFYLTSSSLLTFNVTRT